MRFTLLIIIVLYFSLYGCIPYNKLVNFQENPKDVNPLDTLPLHIPNIKIQANDVLDIKVFGADKEIAAPFNVASAENVGNFFDPQAIQIVGYLVNQEGIIDFPVLGKIAVAGFTISEATEAIKQQLQTHLKDPVVRIRLLNFTITVTGEVNTQGTYTIFNERISLPDALAMAGGLTDYANRKNILLVREDKGKRILKRVDLSSANFFQSDYYYLKQNDMIYVEPLKAKRGAITDQTNKTLPIVSTAATVIAVIFALFK